MKRRETFVAIFSLAIMVFLYILLLSSACYLPRAQGSNKPTPSNLETKVGIAVESGIREAQKPRVLVVIAIDNEGEHEPRWMNIKSAIVAFATLLFLFLLITLTLVKTGKLVLSTKILIISGLILIITILFLAIGVKSGYLRKILLPRFSVFDEESYAGRSSRIGRVMDIHFREKFKDSEGKVLKLTWFHCPQGGESYGTLRTMTRSFWGKKMDKFGDCEGWHQHFETENPSGSANYFNKSLSRFFIMNDFFPDTFRPGDNYINNSSCKWLKSHFPFGIYRYPGHIRRRGSSLCFTDWTLYTGAKGIYRAKKPGFLGTVKISSRGAIFIDGLALKYDSRVELITRKKMGLKSVLLKVTGRDLDGKHVRASFKIPKQAKSGYTIQSKARFSDITTVSVWGGNHGDVFVIRDADAYQRAKGRHGYIASIFNLKESNALDFISRAFKRAKKTRQPVILSGYTHDYNNVSEILARVLPLIEKESRRTGIPFEYVKPNEAFRRVLKFSDRTPPIFSIEVGNKWVISSTESLYGEHPFCAVMDKSGNVSRLSTEPSGKNRWIASTPRKNIVRAVGGIDLSGNSSYLASHKIKLITTSKQWNRLFEKSSGMVTNGLAGQARLSALAMLSEERIISKPLKAESGKWRYISFSAEVPAGTYFFVRWRTGQRQQPDASWSSWKTAKASERWFDIGGNNRFIQIEAKFKKIIPWRSPLLKEIRLLESNPAFPN